MRWKRDRKKDKLPQISCSSFILADVGPQILVRTFYQSDTANNHLPERFNKICRSYEQSFELSIDRRVRTDAFTNFHISQPLYIVQKDCQLNWKISGDRRLASYHLAQNLASKAWDQKRLKNHLAFISLFIPTKFSDKTQWTSNWNTSMYARSWEELNCWGWLIEEQVDEFVIEKYIEISIDT